VFFLITPVLAALSTDLKNSGKLFEASSKLLLSTSFLIFLKEDLTFFLRSKFLSLFIKLCFKAFLADLVIGIVLLD